MNIPSIRVFGSIEELAAHTWEYLARKLQEKALSEKLCLSISGGTAPPLLLRDLADKTIPIARTEAIRLFWCDERCVPASHPDSNYGTAWQSGLNRLHLNEKNIFPIHGDADPVQEAKRYESLIREEVSVIEGWPRFDAILLGMGEDGHTASLFPGQEELFRTNRWCLSNVRPATGQQRITLTGKVLNQAADVFVLVTGSSKAALVSEVLTGKAPENLPINRIMPVHGTITWLLDEAAASALPSRLK